MSAAAGTSRVALVTGAGQGIGAGIARVLSQAGWTVAALDRNEDRAQRTVGELACPGSAIVADVTFSGAAQAAVDTTVQRHGRLDVLVNNVGALRFGGLLDTSEQDWQEAFDGCVKSAWLCMRAAVPYMQRSGGGRIVNVSSIVAQGAPSDGLIAYTAAKSAVIGLTIAAARDLGPLGITVNAISPGAVQTDAWLRFPDPEAMRAQRAQSAVVGRVGSAEEIGHAVRYLASPEAGFTTGQTLVLDGGRIDKL